jgi:hypothetical protein
MALITPALVFVIAIAMAVTAAVQVAPPLTTSAWLFPLFVSAAMAIVSAVLFVGEVAQRRRTVAAASVPAASTDIVRATPARVAGWLALSAGYAIATPQVGFEWATGVFLIFALKVFGGASWRVTLPVAATIALLLPVIFRRVFFTLVP